MFYFRINKLRIVDNHERKNFLGIFGKDLAEVKLLSFVTTDNMELPDMSDFINENDPGKKRDLLKPAIENIIASRNLTTIQNITDNHVMHFGDTGYILYQSKEIPDNFSWQFIAVESD